MGKPSQVYPAPTCHALASSLLLLLDKLPIHRFLRRNIAAHLAATGDLVPKLGMSDPVVADPLPPEVESNAEHENDQQRDDRGRLVDEGREHEC